MKTVSLDSIAIYLHVPFCETKCPYCDFNTYVKIESLIPTYVDALCAEIFLWGDILGKHPVHSVFFGGGTPSYLPTFNIGLIMSAIDSVFSIQDGAEITLESNPGDLVTKNLIDYQSLGINRISIGVQSFDERLLKTLGRRHSASDARTAFKAVEDSGFENISIDLMYGLPFQTINDWEDTIDVTRSLSPQHVSMYCLSLEPGTPLHNDVQSGRIPDPDDDLAADMYLMAQNNMSSGGYRHYEISNWAVPGKESNHNLTYWRNQSYLGVGPGAHSYLLGHRLFNIKSPKEYIHKLNSDVVSEDHVRVQNPVETEHIFDRVPVVESNEIIGRQLEMSETMIMGLRLDTGIEFKSFADRFGTDLMEEYRLEIRQLVEEGLLKRHRGTIKLTSRGRLLGNEVFSRFIR